MKVLRAFACGTFLFPPPWVGPVEVMGLLGTAFKVEPLAHAEKILLGNRENSRLLTTKS
jgi:hypothetical protein